MNNTWLSVFVFLFIEYTNAQFLALGATRKTSRSICDSSAKSGLVEHFFNIIFTEFHNTAPVCVCVQMCPDQPTYCYPNGCLKRAEKTNKVEVPVQKISDNTKPIFFIDENNDFMSDFITKNYIEDSAAAAPVSKPPEKSVNTILRPDPFKDRYKILFNSHKKGPKVELKYNLAEQVKNNEDYKKNNVDVSNTRWPLNKFDRRLSVGSRSKANPPQGNTNSKYFMSMYPDKDSSYLPKYFKRELPNDTNNEVDIKAIYVVGKSETESNIFSLEKLIDSLIESSFDKNVSSPNAGAEIVVTESIVKIQEPIDEVPENSTKPSVKNETTKIVSINFTNENVDKNKYLDDILLNNTNNFSLMIATLSKRIDKQNNTSLEIMKDITGTGDFESEPVPSTSEGPIETMLHTQSENSTTEQTTLPIVYETRTTRKIRKRLVRRLQNGKNN